MSAEGGSIHARLARILDALPAIPKDAENVNLRFSYRSVDSILDALNPLLAKHGVVIIPLRVEACETEVRPTKSGSASVVRLTFTYRFVADDGSYQDAMMVGEGQDSGDKSVSKAATMAFKSLLGQVFAISTGEDPDGESVAPTAGDAPSPARATQGGSDAQARMAERINALTSETRKELLYWLGEQRIPADRAQWRAVDLGAMAQWIDTRHRAADAAPVDEASSGEPFDEPF